MLVREVRVKTGALVDLVEFHHYNGHIERAGQEGGNWQTPFQLAPNEYITIVEGRAGAQLDAISFSTNLGRSSAVYGNMQGGAPFRLQAPTNMQVTGVNRATGNCSRLTTLQLAPFALPQQFPGQTQSFAQGYPGQAIPPSGPTFPGQTPARQPTFPGQTPPTQPSAPPQQGATTSVTVLVPEGVQPGGLFEVVVNGQTHRLTCPNGYYPGMQLTVQLPAQQPAPQGIAPPQQFPQTPPQQFPPAQASQVKTGWMLKESGVWGTMQRRFLKLENNTLRYYESNGSREPSGTIVLSEIGEIVLAPDKDNPNSTLSCVLLKLRNGNRTYRFRAENNRADVAADWHAALTAIWSRVPPSSGTSSRGSSSISNFFSGITKAIGQGFAELNNSNVSQDRPPERCPFCAGKGNFDAWGKPCDAGNMHKRDVCFVCNGRCFFKGATRMQRCNTCTALGGFDAWDKPCTRFNMHFKRNCSACNGQAYFRNGF